MGTARVRHQESISSYNAKQRLYNSAGVQQSEAVQDLYLYNYGYCEDELNEMELLGKTSYDIGGSLLSYQTSHDFKPYTHHGHVDAFGLRWTMDGPLIAYPVYVLGGPTPESSRYISSNLDGILTRVGLGATAINRCRPAKPEAGLAVTIAEAYREGIPSTLKQFSHMKDEVARLREASKAVKARELVPSKYLEYQFGWKPLVSDIRKASRALLDYEAILEDLRRNSGKRMRRRYSFPTTATSEEVTRDWTGPWPNPNSYMLGQAGQRVITKIETKETWFSGEFVYSFPTADVGIPRQMLAGARQLLGLDLTPETIWNVAPWTWAADWFANVGDVVANFTAIGADSLVLRYGYLMQTATRRWRHEHFGVTLQGSQVNNVNVVGETVCTAKSRIVATPFGFGLTDTSLDARQFAIAAAIGLTRGSHGK